MPANPEILSNLKQYLSDKTGGGDPPTGGDKAKAAATAASQTIPLPNYNDPASRLKYAAAVQQKYNLPHGYGDVFTRFNEVPGTATDTLPTKELIARTAAGSGLPPQLFYTSSMVEGMSGLYDQKGTVDYSNNPKFPIDGFSNFGLDNFSDAYPELVKKGYLPADFNKQFTPSKRVNEKNQSVNSANFYDTKAALQAKAAMLRDAQDQVQAYADKNKIPLTDKAKQFLTLAQYNGGPGAAQGMLQEFNKSGTLANDAFLKAKDPKSKYGQVYDNVNQRVQLANALEGEGYKFDPTPAPAPQPIVNK